MILYHGTTTDKLDSIRQNGLVPRPDAEFITAKANDSFFGLPISLTEAKENYSSATKENGGVPTVYVSRNINTAKQFAAFRERYERKQYGETVIWNNSMSMYKLAHSYIPNAKAIVISFDVPEGWQGLEEDLESTSMGEAYKCHCTIPASFLRSVTPVDANKIYYSDGESAYVQDNY